MFNTALGYSNCLINASHTLYIFLAIFLKFFSMIQFYVFHLRIAYDRRTFPVWLWKPLVKTGRFLQLLFTVLFESLSLNLQLLVSAQLVADVLSFFPSLALGLQEVLSGGWGTKLRWSCLCSRPDAMLSLLNQDWFLLGAVFLDRCPAFSLILVQKGGA